MLSNFHTWDESGRLSFIVRLRAALFFQRNVFSQRAGLRMNYDSLILTLTEIFYCFPLIMSAKRTTTTIFSTINRRRERSSSPAPSTLPASLASQSSRKRDTDDAGDGTSGISPGGALTTSLRPSNDSRSTPSSPTPGKRIRARSQDRGVIIWANCRTGNLVVFIIL